MPALQRVLLYLYRGLLRLYPGPFQQEFAAEMETVFGDALAAASREGLRAVLGLCARELGGLPPALASQDWHSKQDKEAGMDKFNGPAGPAARLGSLPTGRPGSQPPAYPWSAVFLAALPFLMLLLIDLVVSLLYSWNIAALRRMNGIFLFLVIAVLLLFFFLSWRQKWPVWSASWSPFFLAPLPILAAWLLGQVFRLESVQDLALYQFIPVSLAFLLYAIARQDRLRGLLATLPVLYLLWFPNMESVKVTVEMPIKIASTALICLAIAFLLRRGGWRQGLYAILVENLVIGALYSYAGTYHGGTLPYVAPGPSLGEVLRSLVPQYLATGAILLGPLFAWKFRQAGRSGGGAGWAGYHLALAGLLLVIFANLTSQMKGTDMVYSVNTSFGKTLLAIEIAAGLVTYLVGLLLIYRRTWRAGAAAWLKRLLLALLPLAIPITFILPFITWKWPISDLYGVPLLWALPQDAILGLGLVWLALSVWVVTGDSAPAAPAAPLSNPSILLDAR